MPDKFADEPIDILARNPGLDLPVQSVESLGQLDGHPEALRQPENGLRPAPLPPPAGQSDANCPGGQTLKLCGHGLLHKLMPSAAETGPTRPDLRANQ